MHRRISYKRRNRDRVRLSRSEKRKIKFDDYITCTVYRDMQVLSKPGEVPPIIGCNYEWSYYKYDPRRKRHIRVGPNPPEPPLKEDTWDKAAYNAITAQHEVPKNVTTRITDKETGIQLYPSNE